jgi:hypothetical protein
MRRGIVVVVLVALVALVALRAQAQETAGDIAQSKQNLALVVNPRPTSTPTATATTTATATPTRSSTPTGTATPTLPPPSFNNCQADPDPAAAPDYPINIVAINKQLETVTLQNVSSAPIDLAGWRMCSITGNQQHPIQGVLAPGQSITYPGPTGLIWNNMEEDDGALYTPDGRLASYLDA